jgi:hypothetical protein
VAASLLHYPQAMTSRRTAARLALGLFVTLIALPQPASADPAFQARVHRETRRMVRVMKRADTRRQQRYDLKDNKLAQAVVQRLLKHPAFAFGGGHRRASMSGRGDKAVFRTSSKSADKLSLLRRLSWRNHSVDLWADGRGGIYFGGTNSGVELGILKRGKRFTYLIGSSNSVGGYELEAKHGRLMLHTHPIGTSRAISQQDINVFTEAAGRSTSKRLTLGKNLQLIASYPRSKAEQPAGWFRNLDVYLFARDQPRDVALLPSHRLYKRALKTIAEHGFTGFNKPRGIIVNPTRSGSVAISQ